MPYTFFGDAFLNDNATAEHEVHMKHEASSTSYVQRIYDKLSLTQCYIAYSHLTIW